MACNKCSFTFFKTLILVLKRSLHSDVAYSLSSRLGAMSKTHVSTPISFNFVPKSTMDTKKLHLKVDNHPLIGFLVL